MKVAVTGATGFLGRYLVPKLLEKGHSCRCWFRRQSDRSGLPESDEVRWIEGGLNDVDAADSLLQGCDAIVHAALDRPGEGFRGVEGDLTQFLETNFLGTLRLLERARTMGVERFVFISTCAVHERILADRPLDETHPLWPLTHYGAHKAAIEKFVHSFGYGLGYPVCALRPTGIYGVAHPVERSKWFRLVRDVVQGKHVECRGGGKEVHVADVASAAEMLLREDRIEGEVFNCYDRYVSQYEVAVLAKELSGSTSEIVGEPTSPKHQIETRKLCERGMSFGGSDRLRATISELVEFVQSHDSTRTRTTVSGRIDEG